LPDVVAANRCCRTELRYRELSNGAYSTNRAPIGKTLVTVDTYSIQVVDPAAYVPIPERYTNSKTSGLSAEVQPGENRNVDFVLNQ
jgi:hypothetical protein